MREVCAAARRWCFAASCPAYARRQRAPEYITDIHENVSEMYAPVKFSAVGSSIACAARVGVCPGGVRQALCQTSRQVKMLRSTVRVDGQSKF